MKTRLFTICFILLSISFYAQSVKGVLFYVDSLHNIANEKNYTYTRIVEDYETEKDSYLFSEYYKSGIRSMKATSKSKDNLVFNGSRIDYYESGNKKQQSTYKNNYLNGIQIEWYENQNKKIERDLSWDHNSQSYIVEILQFWNKDNEHKIIDGNGEYDETTKFFSQKGNIKNNFKQGIWTGNDFKKHFSFIETYEKGKLISGTSTDENNIEYHYTSTEQPPSPPNGISEFYRYVVQNFLVSYGAVIQHKISGDFFLTFIVDKNGKLIDPVLTKDVGYGLQGEITRLIKRAKKWTPGKHRGVPVNVKYTMPIKLTNT
ncbi:MAG: energy transducer TonB [Bacteroidota bacterium]